MRLPRLAAVLAGALLLAGCGAGQDSDDGQASPTAPSATPTASPTATQTPSGPTSPTASATSPSPPPTPTKTPTAAPPPAHDGPPRGAKDLTGLELPQFVNAANDTTCLFEDFEGVHVRCDVMGAAWDVQKPADCPSAYGDSVSLAERAVLVCHGDTIFSPDVTITLKPGESAKFQHLWCTVAAGGVSCSNPGGHGFLVSPSSYSLR